MVSQQLLIESFVERFKNNRLLPIIIHTAKCPSRKPTCRKRHGDIVLDSYDKAAGKFTVRFYSIHDSKLILKTEQLPDNIKENLRKAFRKRLYNKAKLTKMMKKNIQYTTRFYVRLTDDQKEIIKRNAEKMNLSVSEYTRKKLVG